VETGGDDDWLDRILARFPGDDFPATGAFSSFARETLPDVSALDDPDAALVAWMDREEMLFRTLERHHVQKQIDAGFKDVDHFVAVSLSVQNRRKSRAGRAFEAHVETALHAHGLVFETGARTEDNQKPDLLFPSSAAYGNADWAADCLSMLGVKTSCKDRWRQVLAEARRVETKHLLTLERPISVPQTDQMAANRLQLVVSAPYVPAYTDAQQAWVWDVQRFIGHVRAQQSRCGVA